MTEPATFTRRLATIGERWERACADATDEHPVDPLERTYTAAALRAQADMVEQGLCG